MSDEMEKVVLRTACGCTRTMKVPTVATTAMVPFYGPEGQMAHRVFEFKGERDRSGKRVFCELL